jgi:hypothetical protein
MMEDHLDEEDVATWCIFHSDKENREYYFNEATNTASWVLPKGARIYPQDDTQEETETQEGSTPRESGSGFFGDSDDNVIDLVDDATPGSSSKSFLRRFIALVTGYRFGMALLVLNVLLTSSYFGSMLFSNEVVLNENVLETATPMPTAVEQVIAERLAPIPECTNTVTVVEVSVPAEEKEPQPPPMEMEQVKEAAQAAARKGNEIMQRLEDDRLTLTEKEVEVQEGRWSVVEKKGSEIWQKIEGTIESVGKPIANRLSKEPKQPTERVTDVELHQEQPCRSLSRLFSKECRQKFVPEATASVMRFSTFLSNKVPAGRKEQQQASTDA